MVGQGAQARLIVFELPSNKRANSAMPRPSLSRIRATSAQRSADTISCLQHMNSTA
jgi:hypothetical protein